MVIPLDRRPRSGPYSGLNARSAKRFLAEQFSQAGLPFAEDDATELVLAATGYTLTDMLTKGTEFLAPEVFQTLQSHAERRLSGEPVDHILGWREFYGRRFTISKDVLSPRADTEELVRQALAAISGIAAPRILDLGTGSGAILLTLLAEREDVSGLGLDISEAALAVAAQNMTALGLEGRAALLQSAWFSDLPEALKFDAILSNPPYITARAMTELPPEVSGFDPDIALRGGTDGLDSYRLIIDRAPDYFPATGGWLGLEIGYDQSEAVQALLAAKGFIEVCTHRDLGGNPRVVCGNWK